jgi:hypothetical protein
MERPDTSSLSEASTSWTASGFAIDDTFLTPAESRAHSEHIAAYLSEWKLPLIERRAGSRPLHYRVIEGNEITAHLPGLRTLAERVRCTVAGISPACAHFVASESRAVNVNVLEPGGSYLWHYDRNAVTGIVYLNVVAGGEMEMYPMDPNGDDERRSVRDRSGAKVTISPRPGRLLLMRGSKNLHSVAPVRGEQTRFSLVVSLDRLGATSATYDDLDRYIYTDETAGKALRAESHVRAIEASDRERTVRT